jgi:asparagine synthase (glutamine-hydrolysing)
MCGIGGYVDPRGTLDGRRTLQTMADALAHRGPDGEGFVTDEPFGLVHRRLAIIDLSDTGAQPMTVGPVTVVLNGEIYNYRELRAELCRDGHAFRGASDTEVLARAYLHWGERCVEHLRGMWAFALLDQRSQTLICSRDPFGIKPLYYARHRGSFLFASEPTALLAAGVAARAQLSTAAHYLALGITEHEPRTFFEDIQPLRAGTTVAVGADAQLRLLHTLEICDAGRGPASFAEFAHTLQESIGLHLRSDVPVGTCLSGGLDSSTVAALAAAAVRKAGGPRFAAVTAVSSETATDERPYAEAVVQHCDLAWHTVTPSAADFIADMDASISAQGEPALSPSVYFQYCVMRAARAAGLKVMLDGQGADELLGGYERYAATWALEVARRRGPVAALRGFLSVSRNARPGIRGMMLLGAYVLSPALRQRVIAKRIAFLRPDSVHSAQELVGRIASVGRDFHAARVADITQFSLPALLRFEDRNSMAHSIEARVPYVDRGVISCGLRVPDEQLLQHGFTKYPLRTVAATVLPGRIAWRRAKIGFEPPTQTWLGALSAQMQSEVGSCPLIQRLCLQTPRLSEQAPAMQWRLYNLARWRRIFNVDVA